MTVKYSGIEHIFPFKLYSIKSKSNIKCEYSSKVEVPQKGTSIP